MGVSVFFHSRRVCLNHRYLPHLDELAVLLLLEKGVQPVHRHPVVVLDLGEADPEYDHDDDWSNKTKVFLQQMMIATYLLQGILLSR